MIILFPVFCVLNKIRFHNTKKTAQYFVFATYLAAIYLFVGMPTLQFMRFELSLTLIPFLPMLADLKNTILNIILFVPLGIMLPFLWKKYNTLKATLVFGLGMSLAIELLQFFTYRATDVNDIIANTFGTVVGYLIFTIASQFIPAMKNFARRKNEIAVVALSVFVVMFFIQPYLATLFYKIT
jgi:glycopeptide antibiotics resistance protein